jgi:3-oxoacyl-[acyl-carrier protein] reductase
VVGYHHNQRRAQSVVDTALSAAEELGPLRTVVHCVGAWDYPRVTDLDEDIIDRAYRTNLRSALLTAAVYQIRPSTID